MSRHVHIDEEYLSWLDNARMVRLERASAKHLKHLDGRRFDACPRG